MQYRRDPLVEWRETIGRQLLNLDFRQTTDVPFRSVVTPILFTENVRVAEWSHSAGYSFRDRELVRDGSDDYSLVYAGNAYGLRHQGHETGLGAGDASLLHNCETGEVGANTSMRIASVIIPKHAVSFTGEQFNRLIGKRWSGRSRSLRLLKSYIGLLRKQPPLPGSAASGAAARHIVDLVMIAGAEQADTSDLHRDNINSVASIRIELANRFIAERFRDPLLTEEMVAASIGISVRSLQKLFETAGLRFTRLVNELRLSDAAAQLNGGSARSVAEIALAAGFSDISHFNRLFRARFGETPTAMRSGGKRTPLI